MHLCSALGSGYGHAHLTVSVFEIAGDGPRPDICPFADDTLAHESFVLLVGVGEKDRSDYFAAHAAIRSKGSFFTDIRAGAHNALGADVNRSSDDAVGANHRVAIDDDGAFAGIEHHAGINFHIFCDANAVSMQKVRTVHRRTAHRRAAVGKIRFQHGTLPADQVPGIANHDCVDRFSAKLSQQTVKNAG